MRGDSGIAVIIHGGAGKFSSEYTPLKVPFLREAVDAAWTSLKDGQGALRAVEAALRVLEGAEYFNAGYGGYPNEHGIVLADVGLMTGDLTYSSIVNLRRVKYPSSVALDLYSKQRSLMTVWTHERELVLDQASTSVKERYGWVARHEDLVAPHVKRMIERKAAAEVSAQSTVGCVVRDASGKIAAGTSTGGSFCKCNGRIGDSPVIGCGFYADDEVGGLSTTGHGESFLRSLSSGYIVGAVRAKLAEDVDLFIEQPDALTEILSRELARMQSRTAGTGAVIFLPARGEPRFSFTSEMVSTGSRFEKADGSVREKIGIALSDGSFIT